MLLRHDAFTRTSLDRMIYTNNNLGMKASCFWCGTVKATLYSYCVVRDDSTAKPNHSHLNLFCNLACYDACYSNN